VENSSAHLSVAAGLFAGGGMMGELMRSFDWSQSPLGPVETWPQSLKTTISTCLDSRFAILIWWGPDFVTFYNDGYMKIIGNKHPRALGSKARDLWPEIWHIIGPMLEGVMVRSEATWSDNLLLELERNGYQEECYFTFSYSPIRDESGGVPSAIWPKAPERRMRKAAKRFADWRARRWQTTSTMFRLPPSICSMATMRFAPERPASPASARCFRLRWNRMRSGSSGMPSTVPAPPPFPCRRSGRTCPPARGRYHP